MGEATSECIFHSIISAMAQQGVDKKHVSTSGKEKKMVAKAKLTQVAVSDCRENFAMRLPSSGKKVLKKLQILLQLIAHGYGRFFCHKNATFLQFDGTFSLFPSGDL